MKWSEFTGMWIILALGSNILGFTVVLTRKATPGIMDIKRQFPNENPHNLYIYNTASAPL